MQCDYLILQMRIILNRNSHPMRGASTPYTLAYMEFYTDQKNEVLTTKTTVTRIYTSIQINGYQYEEQYGKINGYQYRVI